jgi:hypothetical protein
MPPADNSYAALYRRRKGFLLAAFHEANKNVPELGPRGGVAPESTYLDRKAGQQSYITQPAQTVIVEKPCGCP